MILRRTLLGSCLSVSLSALGCGGVADSAGGGGGGGGGGATFDGVQGTAFDTYDIFSKTISQPVPKTTWSSISARSGGKSFAGTLDAEGKLQIPDVPEGPYQLLLARSNDDVPGAPDFLSVYDETARTLDLGMARSHRAGLVPMTKSSIMTLSASLTLPWHAYKDDGMGNVQPLDDVLQMFSRSTAVNASLTASGATMGTPPADGAMSLSGWSLDAFKSLPYSDVGVSQFSAAENDDAVFLHNVATHIDDAGEPAGSPWASFDYDATAEVLEAAPFTLTDGGTVEIGGAFKAVQQKAFSFHFKGSAFMKAFGDAPTTAPTSGYVAASVMMEPGSPAPAQGGDANLLELFVSARTAYANPACNPNNCDMAACGAECGSGATFVMPGDYARELAYGNPFTYGQELFSVSVVISTKVTTLLPDTTSERLRGIINVQLPVNEASGADIVPVVSLPRQVTVGGAATPVDAITKGVGLTPVIAFEAPSTGHVDAYLVQTILLDDQKNTAGGAVLRSAVASIWTQATSVTIPSGVLESGKHYNFQVTAMAQPGYDPAKPNAYSAHTATAQTFTGVVMP